MLTLMDMLVQLEHCRTSLNRTGQERLEQLVYSKELPREADKSSKVQPADQPVTVPEPCCQPTTA